MTSLTEPLVLLLFRSCSPRHPPLYLSLSLSLSFSLCVSVVPALLSMCFIYIFTEQTPVSPIFILIADVQIVMVLSWHYARLQQIVLVPLMTLCTAPGLNHSLGEMTSTGVLGHDIFGVCLIPLPPFYFNLACFLPLSLGVIVYS